MGVREKRYAAIDALLDEVEAFDPQFDRFSMPGRIAEFQSFFTNFSGLGEITLGEFERACKGKYVAGASLCAWRASPSPDSAYWDMVFDEWKTSI
ncbi:hypothetical protein [Parahaliea aestuarii]|uniref:Uncharacterized protein n=1 Tax=Parahaliea aestuarii TaxID=1852021 RepID=A0A5C9A548_9GAMM|nr:hypothetical protein [Parahaliea aestuarii]TXS95112.1 hypothetical protein FVW59_04235 [Parahaliea aestuarii]